MQSNNKIKYIGEIAVILLLEIIMLLFRVVQPIKWPSGLPRIWQTFGNGWIFLLIEFTLIIVIVEHFIFKHSFKDMGIMTKERKVGALITNGLMIPVMMVAMYMGSIFNKGISFDLLEAIITIVINFAAIAFIQELLFRGVLFNHLMKVLDGKGIIVALIVAVLSTLTYIPELLLRLPDVQASIVIGELTLPFVIAIYLGLLRYYGRDLGACIGVHGVWLTLIIGTENIFMTLLGGVYAFGAVCVLISKMIKFYRQDEENEVLEDEIEEGQVEHQREDQMEDPKEEESCAIKEEPLEQEITLAQPVEDMTSREKAEVPTALEEESIHEEVLVEMLSTDEEDVDMAVKEDTVPEQTTNEQEAEMVVMPLIKESLHESNLAHKEPNFIAYLEKYLGDFEGIYKQAMPTEPAVDILYFTGEHYNALVTNGMRGIPMMVPPELEEYKQAELMVFVDKGFDLSDEGIRESANGWLVKLLGDLAIYPRTYNTFLGWGHVVGNTGELLPYDDSVGYCGALIYPPMDQEDKTFYRYEEKENSIFIYNVMPLYEEELRFVQENSSDRLITQIQQMNMKQCIVPSRPKIVE